MTSLFLFYLKNKILFLQKKSLCQLIEVPNLIHPTFVEIRLMADYENATLVFFQSSLELLFGIDIQVVGRLVQHQNIIFSVHEKTQADFGLLST